MRANIKKIPAILALLSIAFFPLAAANAQINRGEMAKRLLAQFQSGEQSTSAGKESIVKLMDSVKDALGKLRDEKLTLSDFESAVDKLSDIDASSCPSEVKEKFGVFISDLKQNLAELKKIFKDANLLDTEELVKAGRNNLSSNPELASKILQCSSALRKSAQEFANSAVPYMVAP